MLTRVEITKFKSCADLVVDELGGITALVGRNGAGKTNILQAIDWTARTATRGLHLDDPGLREAIGTTVHIELPEGRYIYQIRAGLDESGVVAPFWIKESLACLYPDGKVNPVFIRDRGSIVIESSQEVHVGFASSAMPALLAVLPAEASVLARIRPIYSFLRAVRYYPLDEPTNVTEAAFVEEADYRKWLAGYRADGDVGDSVVYPLINMKLEDDEKYQELRTLLGASGIDLVDRLAVVSVPIGSTVPRQQRTIYSLGFRIGDTSIDFKWNQLSLGTRRVVRLLISLIFDKSTVMLIEHPEDGIHRGLLRKLIGLLKTYSDPTQVILASHSGVVLNSLAPREARLVSLDSGKTVVRPLDDREIELATHFLEEEGTLEDFLETIQQED